MHMRARMQLVRRVVEGLFVRSGQYVVILRFSAQITGCQPSPRMCSQSGIQNGCAWRGCVSVGHSGPLCSVQCEKTLKTTQCTALCTNSIFTKTYFKFGFFHRFHRVLSRDESSTTHNSTHFLTCVVYVLCIDRLMIIWTSIAKTLLFLKVFVIFSIFW